LAPNASALIHVRAAANAAVDDELDAIADRIAHARDAIDRRRRGLELPAAVIGDHDRRGADLHGMLRILDRLQSLDGERTAPLLDQPGHVVPVQRTVVLTVHVFDDRRVCVRHDGIAMREVGEPEIVMPDELQPPPRMRREAREAAQREARLHGHAGSLVALTVPGDHRIHGETQCIVARRLAALDEFAGELAILEDVDLEHLRPGAYLADALEPRRRKRRETVIGAELRRGARHRRLRLVME
jgi:hypothetical protein